VGSLTTVLLTALGCSIWYLAGDSDLGRAESEGRWIRVKPGSCTLALGIAGLLRKHEPAGTEKWVNNQ
jgi:hypothetical protein